MGEGEEGLGVCVSKIGQKSITYYLNGPLDCIKRVALASLGLLPSLIAHWAGFALKIEDIIRRLGRQYPPAIIWANRIGGPLAAGLCCYTPLYAASDLVSISSTSYAQLLHS